MVGRKPWDALDMYVKVASMLSAYKRRRVVVMVVVWDVRWLSEI